MGARSGRQLPDVTRRATNRREEPFACKRGVVHTAARHRRKKPHVADGWAARNFDQLQLRESEEMKDDRDYLQRVAADLAARGLKVSTELAMGDPADELIRLAQERNVDLLAMSTHGHRFLNDLLRGTTVNRVRHLVKIPILLVRAQ